MALEDRAQFAATELLESGLVGAHVMRALAREEVGLAGSVPHPIRSAGLLKLARQLDRNPTVDFTQEVD